VRLKATAYRETIMKKTAAIGLIVMFSFTIVFHLMVMMKFVPHAIVWGGRLHSEAEMLRMEAVSILTVVFFLMVVLAKTEIIRIRIPGVIINTALWVMFGLTVANTLGNILAASYLEKIIFTPVTILISVFILILLLNKK
jgi:hypothetical protein